MVKFTKFWIFQEKEEYRNRKTHRIFFFAQGRKKQKKAECPRQ